MFNFVIVALSFCIFGVHNANILFLLGVPSPSHHIWNSPIVTEVARRGHNVTVLSSMVDKKAPKNVHFIHLERMDATLSNGSSGNDIVKRSKEGCIQKVLSFYRYGWLACKGATQSEGFKTLMNYPDDFRFDLIIHDVSSGPCLLVYLDKFKNASLMGIAAFNNPHFSKSLVGGHKYPAYSSHFAGAFHQDMNFFERVLNHLLFWFDSLYRRFKFVPDMEEMVQSVVDFQITPFAEQEKQTQILLINTHPALDPPEPLAPNVISVGGIQMKSPKSLPKEIEKFVNASKKGFVLFSLGTNFKGSMFHVAKQRMFLNVFSNFSEFNFLWKIDESELKDELPENVMIQPWLPQNDVLAHPKIKGFITHGGLLSTQEAAWYGVPMIGVPIYVDQQKNIAYYVRAGLAWSLSYHEMTEACIIDALQKILQEKLFTEKMKQISIRFRDQPDSPLQRAVWWIEWTLRHPKSDFMRSPVLRLGTIRSEGYDVMLFVFLTTTFSVLCIFKAISIVTRKILDRNKVKFD